MPALVDPRRHPTHPAQPAQAVSAFSRNACPESPGTSVRLPPESLSVFSRTTQPAAGPQRDCHVPHARVATGVGALYSPGTVVLFQADHDHRPAPVASLRPVPAPRHNNPSIELRTPPSRAAHVGAGTGLLSTDPKSALRHQPNLQPRGFTVCVRPRVALVEPEALSCAVCWRPAWSLAGLVARSS